jgi:ferritin-like metal-binding protein YciE
MMLVSAQDAIGVVDRPLEDEIASALDVPDEDVGSMRSLIREVDRIIRGGGALDARDLALVAAARRIEQLEIASYRMARALAAS